MRIGHKIKQLRIKQDLTIDELAARCELTKGFISQIERDKSSPSIETLQDILKVLNCSLSDFFLTDDQSESYVFLKQDMAEKITTDYSLQWLVTKSQAHNIEPTMLVIKPKKQSPIIAPFVGEIFGLVLKGRVNVINGEQELIAKTGDAFYLVANKEHYLENLLNEESKVIWITSPPNF